MKLLLLFKTPIYKKTLLTRHHLSKIEAPFARYHSILKANSHLLSLITCIACVYDNGYRPSSLKKFRDTNHGSFSLIILSPSQHLRLSVQNLISYFSDQLVI
ncbi:hypothetical protein FD33_GL000406 [Companilactobacillus paralimentarius DSM 13238 = JCM 10415]|uniref:Uncharacterized protein n=1 Tax=Companilactobacillus paralimentarius DSM 13238 = JCM 10415 TaxID=1122151 RepID=A0A0R1PC78_9LACO|nr:hypothetical protein FD33_GL000406 [Companilactobacillus paralimentarius DSM 13238 = JCM 10415]